jgi:hypothetical protein
MKRTTIIVAIGLALIATLSAAPANAQAARTFVSPTGSDSNLCTLVAPCRYFQAAFAQTNAGGEIAVLGTAGYNNGATFTINKAISIVNPGGFEAGIIVPSGGNGIVIAAGVNDAVSLRGLTIEGGGVGQTGIQFNSGASLTVVNCVSRHMTNYGINFFPNATSSLAVSNSVVADNGVDGVHLQPGGSGAVTAVFDHVEANNNGSSGINVLGNASTGTVNVTVSESVVAHNPTAGLTAFSVTGQAPTTLSVFHSVVASNGFSLYADGTGVTLRVAQSMVTGNTNGWLAADGGELDSYGDNYIDGNGGNIGSLTPIARQ